MKKIILITILFLFTVACLLADSPVAVLLKAKGDVKLVRNAKNLKVKNGDMLYNNDQLQTGVESYAAIKYVDNSASLKLFPNSIMKISAQKNNGGLDKSSVMQKGSLMSSINSKIKGTYKVESPTTVASVKGTQFLSTLLEDGTFLIYTFEGIVYVVNLKSGDSQDVAAGFTLQSNPDGGITTSPFDPTQLPPEIQNLLNENNTPKKVKVEMQNSSGQTKYIIIETE